MKIVFLTGCANGIGRHLATVFYQRGDAVVVTDVDETRIRELTTTWDADRVLVARLDVRNLANWQATCMNLTPPTSTSFSIST